MHINPYPLSPYPVADPLGSPSEPGESQALLGQPADDPLPGDESAGEEAASPGATPALIAALGPTRGTIVAVVEAAAALLREDPVPGENVFLELSGPPAEPGPAADPSTDLRPVELAGGRPLDTVPLPGEGTSVESVFPELPGAPAGSTAAADVELAAALGATASGGAPAATPSTSVPREAAPRGRGAAAPEDAAAAQARAGKGTGESSLNPEELSEEEQQEVEELQKRDREVRQHEQAHVAAGGPYVRGGPQYEYTRGPDQRQYAVGGEVDIDTSEIPDDPEATVRKAQVVYRAALAPAEPSPQDRRVASEAKQMESEARRDITVERREETQEASEEQADEAAEADETAEAGGAGQAQSAPGGPGGASPAGATPPGDDSARGSGRPVVDLDHGLDGTGEDMGKIVDLLA